MKFLIDENIFPKIISYLRDMGHDVKSLQEGGIFRTTDDKIIQMAKSEGRTIITGLLLHLTNTLVISRNIRLRILLE